MYILCPSQTMASLSCDSDGPHTYDIASYSGRASSDASMSSHRMASLEPPGKRRSNRICLVSSVVL